MRQAYRMLLRLYTREHRVQFGDEMLAVFTQAAEERRAQGWFAYARFIVNEYIGLLSGAFLQRPRRVSFAPALGGIAVAAVLHAAFYAAASRVLHATAVALKSSAVPPADPRTEVLTLGIFGVTSLLCLLPLFFLLSMQVMQCRRANSARRTRFQA